MPVITARQKVLAYLAKQPNASANEIGRSLNMLPAAVRHHLSVLLADGRISTAGRRETSRRGRPVKEYRLSEKTIGDNFGMLSEVLLRGSAHMDSPKASEEFMVVLAKGFAEIMGPVDPNLPAARRLAMVMEKLIQAHYQARWEAGRDGPRILFAHCPYAAIIASHPELCKMDAALLEENFEVCTRQISKIDTTAGGVTHCIFVLGENERIPVARGISEH